MITKGERWFLRFAGVLSCIFTLSALWTLRSTIFPPELIASSETAVRPVWNKGILTIEEQRILVLSRDVNLHIRRTLVSVPQGERISLNDGSIALEEGVRHITRSFLLPSHIRGVWCVKTVVVWWPFMSLTEQSIPLNDSCFEVKNNDD